MLGSQPLSVLLEALQCPLAEQVLAEHARAPALCPCPPAAFLYIEGVFYVHQPAGAAGTEPVCELHPAAGVPCPGCAGAAAAAMVKCTLASLEGACRGS